ncbi:MAG: acetyl-CoA carboxylase biotin carboxylase subunit [Tuberibacillus sp.]
MKKILIANRGEIAARIIRTCQRLGIETVAVYSDADQNLPYIKEATEAYRLGEAPAQKSYMNQDLILDIAQETHCDAIHPGYGFLSENPSFVKKVEERGLIFIGPDARAVELMGDKIQAREMMKQAGVPVVPGSDGPCSSVEEAAQIAESLGYPVMLKASAGGGGIGMQLCHSREELEKAFASNQNRAKAYFGNAALFVESAVINGRHIEVQVFADHHGNIVHLFERDCSVQRRHQKVIEESPSPFLSEATRKKMTDAAILAAKAVNYRNAGTIEFIVDESENFYFLEMNTRLQVEHPVTEAITGLDLVEWQILVASGEKLPLEQSDITSRGHAIEFRLYAEDPASFLPSPGTLNVWMFPETEGVRVDTGYAEGCQVTPYYDPMIAKIIVSVENRADAIAKAAAFFKSMKVEGIKTNQSLFIQLLESSAFKDGNYTTALLKK